MIRLIFMLCLFARVASAAIYYVDFVGGSDAANGTTTSTPFQHAPGDNNATGTAASTTLSAGDKVIFKGGVGYIGRVDLDWSGTSGSPIWYDGNSDGTFGTGMASFNFTNAPTPTVGMQASAARQWIVITNLLFTEIGGYDQEDPAGVGPLASKTGSGVDFDTFNGSSNLVIAACIFREIGEWRNKTNFNSDTPVGAGISMENCQNSIIRDCGFSRVTYPVNIKTDGGKTVGIMLSNSWMNSNIIWAVDIASRQAGDTLSNVSVVHCTFTNYHTFSLLSWVGLGNHPHVDGLFLRRNYTNHHTSGIRFAKNYFGSLGGEGGGTASIHISEGPSATVVSNVFDNPPDSPALYFNLGPGINSDAQFVTVEYNTFFAQTAISFNDSPSVLGTITVRNNIFDFNRTGVGDWFVLNFYDAILPTAFVLDYNIYCTSEDDLSVAFQTGLGGYVTFAELQGGTIGQVVETNGKYSATASYVGFVNRAAGGDFNLTAGSPAIGASSNGGDIGAFPFIASTTYRGFSFGSGVKLIGAGRVTQ